VFAKSTWAPRALALMLCVPLFGGRGLALMVDAIIYPHGACCCERAHGLTHHCRCADPHGEDEVDAAHELGECPAQWDDGGDEYGAPNLLSLPVGALSEPPQIADLSRPWHQIIRIRALDEGRPAPPPTPPPNARQV
jgi:hypothetical protein